MATEANLPIPPSAPGAATAPGGQVFIDENTLNLMANRITQLESQLAAYANVAANIRTTQLKLPKPPETNGRQPSPINWTYKMEMYLLAQRINLEDAACVTFAAAYLRDSALNWWLQVSRDAAEGRAPALDTWAKFKAAFVARFTPISPEVSAREELDRLCQTGPVSAYATAFTSLMLELPHMDEADRVHRFIRGLKPAVRMEIRLRQPKTLADAIELALQADSLLWAAEGRNRPRFMSKPVFKLTNQREGPAPMELGSMQPTDNDSGSTELNKLEQSIPPTRSDVVCYYCHQRGHFKRDCRKLKAAQSRRSQVQSSTTVRQNRPPPRSN